MSDNKKERQLPGKDYFHNYKGNPDIKKHKREITDTQKLEFAAAFSEEEEDDVKAYTPAPKKETEPEKVVPVEVSDEDLYAIPDFDSDGFFASLGVPVQEKKNKEFQSGDAGNTKSFEKLQSNEIDSTRAFSKEEFVQVHEEKEEKATKTSKIDSLSDTLSNTLHFNLRSKTKGGAQSKGKKNLMQNFRVLSKNREDRTILEAAPVGKGGKTFADSVKAKKGEDIFEAVEKAYLNKEEEPEVKADNKSIRKERNEKGARRGEEIKNQLAEDIKKHKQGIVAYGVLFVLSAVLTMFFSKTGFYAYVNLLISAVACALSYPLFKKSVDAIKNLNAVSDTALAVMSFFVLIHNICVIALGHQINVYTLCIVFACLMRVCSGYFRLKSRARIVSMALKSKSLSIMQRIPVKNDAATFASGNNDDEPDIFYCTEAYLDTSVEEPEYEFSKESKYYVFTMSAVLTGALFIGLLCFITELAGLSFVTALTAAVCMLMPVMYDPISRMIFYMNGKDMLKQGACISGREALAHIGKSDGFVLDAKDVFSGDVTRFRKSAITQISQNDSAVFAALLMREADSVLAPCFDEFLEYMNITLPPVENFLYEERLGYSAWVLDRKILVGNRKMLINHSISVPSKEHEKAYGKGRHVMYVVIDGEITATFLVRYKVLSSLRKYSRDFNKTGLVIMLSSKEAFLDEETVAAMLSLDASSVKVLSSKATSIMDKYNSGNGKQSATGLLCSSKKRSIMHLIMGCYHANAADKLIMMLLLMGQLLGLLLLVLSPVLNMPVFMNPMTIVVLRIMWGIIVNAVINQKK